MGKPFNKKESFQEKAAQSNETAGSPDPGAVNYKGLVEAANSVILSIDHKGLISYINPFGLAFFGFDQGELLGKSPMETIVPKTFSDDTDAPSFGNIIENPQQYANHTNENIKKNGTRVWISWSNQAIFDEDRNLKEILCVGNDVTRLKAVEAELEGRVRDKATALSSARQDLEDSRDRLEIIEIISRCILEEKSLDATITRVFDKLTRIFKGCGVGIMEVVPGSSFLTIAHAKPPEKGKDLTGHRLDMAAARPFFKELIQTPRVMAFEDIQFVAREKGLDAFWQTNQVRSVMVAPLRQKERMPGLLFIYGLDTRAWTRDENLLLEQTAAALSVGIRHLKHRDQLVAQEQFLDNVVEGVDIAIFVLEAGRKGQMVFKTCNRNFQVSRHLRSVRYKGISFSHLKGKLPQGTLALLEEKVQACVVSRKPIHFIEQTRTGQKVFDWLTRLNPILDDLGQVVRIIGASTDITEQKAIESALEKNQARLMDAQKIARIGDWEREVEQLTFSCSSQLYDIFGWEENTCPAQADFVKLLHPQDRDEVLNTIDEAVKTGSSYDMEYRIIAADNQEKIIREIGRVAVDEKGRAVKIAGVVQDITQVRKFKDELKLARTVFDNALEGVVVTDKEGTIQFVNKGFTHITGYTQEEALNENPRILKSGRHEDAFYKEMWDTLEKTGHWSGEIWNRRKSGEAYPQWLAITAVKNHKGEVTRYMSIFNDLSALREREEQLKFQANYDALTGLPNRSLLFDRLEMSIRRVKREEHGLALIFLDMDDFKHVNDTLGHAKGDLLLQQFATRILECIREQDTIARYGGDEFIILIPDTNEIQVITQVIERIRESLKKSFVIGGKEFFMGASIGVTTCPDNGLEPDLLIANADMAMYRCKEEGKGSYAFFTPKLNEQVARRVELETDLRNGIAREQFTLFFQPKLDLATQKICGAEALIRWHHPEKGLVSPGEFIPLAEETGLINPMGEWILEQACIKAKEWSLILGKPFPIAVNISARQVRDVDLVDLVASNLRRYQVPSSCLELEITESAVMGNVQRACDLFKAIHDLGVRISLDDFGTGFSSLSYLRILPITTLKIDKSFVDDIPHDTDSNNMVATIISMARQLNLATVAEGVEDESQLKFLKENHCSQIQGYYFAKPMSEEALLPFIKKHQSG